MHYVYHPIKGTKLVTPEQYQRYLDKGWFDTPAKFPQNREAAAIVRLTPPELILPTGTVPRGTSEEEDLGNQEVKVIGEDEKIAKPRGRPKVNRTGT